MMKYLTILVLFSVLTVIYAATENDKTNAIKNALEDCRTTTKSLCLRPSSDNEIVRTTCNSKTTTHTWSNAEPQLQKYAKKTLTRSYDLLGLAINHGSHTRNRPGFAKLFQQLSDDSFENTIKLIKYITTRGGTMKFEEAAGGLNKEQFYSSEFESMSIAQGIEKELLEFAHSFDHSTHDPNTLHFIEEEFIEPKTDVLRKMTGYVQDLDKLLSTGPKDSTLNLFLFDEYLQK